MTNSGEGGRHTIGIKRPSHMPVTGPLVCATPCAFPVRKADQFPTDTGAVTALRGKLLSHPME
jgi:hypothetical protein